MVRPVISAVKATVYLFGQIQTSQTGGQLYIDTSPFDEWSLIVRLVLVGQVF